MANTTSASAHNLDQKAALFDQAHVLHELKHYLPSQTPLKDFIHHNSLHAYQHMKFFPAIFKAGKIFGYQISLQLQEFRQLYQNGRIKEPVLNRVLEKEKGIGDLDIWKGRLLRKPYDTNVQPRIGQLRAHWRSHCQLDMDGLVHPLLFRVIGSYLDQGVANWVFPQHEKGFLAALSALEQNGVSSLFRGKIAPKRLLSGETALGSLLELVVGDAAYYEQYLFDQQFAHQGWSGICAAIETTPGVLLDERKISLEAFICFELLLEIDALECRFGSHWKPLSHFVQHQPLDLFEDQPHSELEQVIMLWQKAFEWSYYDEVLAGLRSVQGKTAEKETHSFQALFCIDERECSLRRHIESVDPHCQTLGTPGFFGVEFFFQAQHSKFYEKLCPAPVTPRYLIRESGATGQRGHEWLYSKESNKTLSGLYMTLLGGFWALVRLLQTLFTPKMSPAISDAFAHMSPDGKLSILFEGEYDKERGLQVGFTPEEMAVRVEGQLRGTGLISNFAPLVYALAHGSSSANNPHHSAHDCGACSGRPGSVNSRVFAAMANYPQVRAILRERGIDIPDDTQFVGGMHDTAADEIHFSDEQLLHEDNQKRHAQNKLAFEKALDLNAKERSRRFASIATRQPITRIRRAIKDRSVSMFEPRPELGHGTNALCIVGRRDMTRSLFLDRRAFLNSYDYSTDPAGQYLTGIMRPLGPVCGGINLEYYFSRVDNYKLGAGTKLPHHVMGLIGVSNSADGDLRPGLPLQMIEVHDPVRLLILVEHYPEVVLKCIQSAPEMYEWYINEWVHLVAIHPDTGAFHYFSEGHFELYEPLETQIPALGAFHTFVENAREMETNQIADATRENLPVYSLN